MDPSAAATSVTPSEEDAILCQDLPGAVDSAQVAPELVERQIGPIAVASPPTAAANLVPSDEPATAFQFAFGAVVSIQFWAAMELVAITSPTAIAFNTYSLSFRIIGKTASLVAGKPRERQAGLLQRFLGSIQTHPTVSPNCFRCRCIGQFARKGSQYHARPSHVVGRFATCALRLECQRFGASPSQTGGGGQTILLQNLYADLTTSTSTAVSLGA
jgi:hypothetical protein